MSREVVLAVISVVLFLSSATFAALFTWQYLENNDGQKSNTTTPNTTTVDGCPFYPEPQKLDFSKDKEFENLFSWLDSYINSTVDANTRPSVVANLVYLGQTVWSGYFGRMSKDDARTPDENTIYRIASISKVFPSLYLYKLWEDGQVDLYDPVTKYAPDFIMEPTFGSTDDINLVDMASQISGLQGSLPFDLITGSAIVFNGTLVDAMNALKNETLMAEPRTTCIYSNLAYPLLASILARNFSDGNFTNWAEKNVVEPLGLTNTGFSFDDAVKGKMATGYMPNGDVAPVYDILWYGPAGNYYSTTADMAKFSSSFLETSKTILTHETLEEMMRPRKTCHHGYLANLTGSPWEMNVLDENLIVRKDGDIQGYSSTMALVPDLKLAFNVLMSGSRSENVAHIVLEKAIPTFRRALRKLEQKVTPTPGAEKYIGMFSYYNIQNQSIEANKDGVLLMTNSQEPARYNTTGLSYVSETVFRLKILGGEYPCVGTLDSQNNAVVHFNNFTNGKYNEFDIPERFIFGFKRLN